ncbi:MULTISPECIES: DUF4232 domain-containing protein [unclassified Streptomyces]|uniref:DUF4232 domain-containing protein n=1 Tax=unclassified Streptomyces TaxID=2593676 RepID=UPI00225C1DF8|nr:MULTISPECIES: DUF4232 domain-containing protein [unclassified Streptomyces]WSP56169.1 DUF4232 domain-containing protein [Streptomyces sp. NBC_01241]WSU23134.1 DUF4232 domain-containing protein [Streptomyces sp. NBC_01108]MCX4787872.1 DUF4232 domain-containing protein [Streptomyces sp. NBC_01221]WSJ37602.1 DUF4232 domain-containing protein [Streptomyces sp. NBC_01321]WSP64000.1 DUF4232 domain-containing protein [Streptomyces sp. NBC_01240]
MSTLRNRTTVLAAATTAVLALALTACDGDDSGTKSAGPASGNSAAASSPETPKDASAANTDTAKGSGTAGGSTTTGGDTSDSYAYKHPCKSGDLSVRVYPREGSATQQVIEVNNTGANSCGLSYFPQVRLGASKASDHSGDIKPAVPGGLGGAPAYPVKPKTAAIAVIDLNPSGANGLTWIDEMNVLADGDHMANAETQNFELGPDVKVLDPKLGLYRSTVAEAVSSMKQAGTS